LVLGKEGIPMGEIRQRLIDLLKKDIQDWGEEAKFYDKQVLSLEELGSPDAQTGREWAEKRRSRIVEYKGILELLETEQEIQ
jgi:hypothetical protein